VSPDGQKILAFLNEVATERQHQAKDPVLAQRVRAVKAYQHARFAATYADMLSDVRFGPATRFFLDDLYGPHDFTARDGQFARIVPALVRLFPAEIVRTVAALSELHALSEQLDGQMAQALPETTFDESGYALAWRSVGQPAAREQQIQLMLQVGHALDKLTQKPLLRHSLRLMRGPASAAGLGALQQFLERGFDTFRGMQGAQYLLDTIAGRERSLAAQLFA
jgi:hypothetical protein